MHFFIPLYKKEMRGLLLLGFVAVSSGISGYIETCSGWQLNRYPEVKRFVKETGGADLYENLDVRYVAGHNPDLVVTRNDGTELKRIDLKAYPTAEGLHTLLKEEGFETQELRNKNPDCIAWAKDEECKNNPTFMNKNCAKACHDYEHKSEL